MQSYRRVVSDVVQYEQAAMAVTQVDAAKNILNTETGKVLTGVSSRQEALRRAIKRMADNGLTGFVDRGGHNWQPETYINMDIRSTCGNVATEAVFARNEEYGNDLFWVTVKATARPAVESGREEHILGWLRHAQQDREAGHKFRCVLPTRPGG